MAVCVFKLLGPVAPALSTGAGTGVPRWWYRHRYTGGGAGTGTTDRYRAGPGRAGTGVPVTGAGTGGGPVPVYVLKGRTYTANQPCLYLFAVVRFRWR